jgi:hypothetical protein
MKIDPRISDYINSAPSPQREIMYKIRELIYKVVPDAKEAFKWGSPVFSRIKAICYLAAFRKHVTFAFYDGRMLRDPDGILEGTGKMMKHIKLSNPGDIDEEQLSKSGSHLKFENYFVT